MAAKRIQNFWSAVRGVFAGLVARDASGATEDGVALQADKADGALHVKELVTPAGGGTPLARVGSPGRLPSNYPEDLDGITGVWHPLTARVSVVRTVGAGPVAAAAVGTQVTVSGIIAGTTTIADIQTAIAADPASAELLELQGTGTDVVGAGYAGGAAEDLWAEGMIPAHVLCVLGPDGYVWPASGHAETLGPVAARVHDTDLQAALLAGTGTKDLLVDGETVGDIALAAGIATYLCEWIDVTRYLYLAWQIYGVGANPVTTERAYVSAHPDGSGGGFLSNQTGFALGVGGAGWAQDGTFPNGSWTYNHGQVAVFRGFRAAAVSALGATCRFNLVGWRF